MKNYGHILTKILGKSGKTFEELSDASKRQYTNWERILSGKPLTPEQLKIALEEEREILVKRLTNTSIQLGSYEDMSLKDRINIYDFILLTLSSPEEAAKKLYQMLIAMEKRLVQLDRGGRKLNVEKKIQQENRKD